MRITRCVCHDITFQTLKRLAEAEGLDFEQLRRRTGCGSGCGLCEPYVRLMLSTGRTSFSPTEPVKKNGPGLLDPGPRHD